MRETHASASSDVSQREQLAIRTLRTRFMVHKREDGDACVLVSDVYKSTVPKNIVWNFAVTLRYTNGCFSCIKLHAFGSKALQARVECYQIIIKQSFCQEIDMIIYSTISSSIFVPMYFVRVFHFSLYSFLYQIKYSSFSYLLKHN